MLACSVGRRKQAKWSTLPSSFTFLRYQMRIAGTEYNAAAKTIIALIARKCLMTGFVDEKQKIVCGRFWLFIRNRLHRPRVGEARNKYKNFKRGVCDQSLANTLSRAQAKPPLSATQSERVTPWKIMRSSSSRC
jgi:hypothetical protein